MQSNLSPRWALALISLASFMTALDTLVVVTALPAIGRSFETSLTSLQWTVNAYELAYAAGIILAVSLGDRFGRRRIFLLGLVLFTVASAACALAPNAMTLIAARSLEGAGASMVAPLGLTILTTVFPASRRGMAVGIVGGVSGLAIAGGPLVGGAVIQGIDWHWIFWLNVPVGLALISLSVIHLPESVGPATRLDPLGALLVAGGVASLVWGLAQSNELGWENSWTLAAMGVGITLIAGFACWERRVCEPMIPLRLFRNPAFDATMTTGFFMMAAQFSAAFLITQYLQEALGYSPFAAGLRFLPMTAAPLVVAPLAGKLSDRIGSRPLMTLGLVLQAAGLLWFARMATAGAGYTELIVPLLLAGAGVSMPFATVGSTAVSVVMPRDIGKASGVNSMALTFGGSFGIALVTTVFSSYSHLGTSAGFVSGLHPALLVVAALALLGAIAAPGAGRRQMPAREDGSAVLPTDGALEEVAI